MSTYHKIKNALDTYLEQEKLVDEMSERFSASYELFMGEPVCIKDESSKLERELRSLERGLDHALKNIERLVDENTCPIDLINRYTENKQKALSKYN